MATPSSDPIPFTVLLEDLNPLDSLEMKGLAYLPHDMSELLPAMWVIGLPGGTYRGTAYYDRQVPSLVPFAYSMARHFAHAGIGFLTFDTLGTGDNTLPNGERLTRHVLGDVYAHLVSEVRQGLLDGTLVANLSPVDSERLWIAGMGHSMGGLLLTQIQGAHNPFDATIMLGWAQGDMETPGVDLPALMGMWKIENGYMISTKDVRRAMRPFFYSPDVPTTLIQADELDACNVPSGLMEALEKPGLLAEMAAGIQGPVCLHFAERDVTSHPRSELAWYASASPITISIQPESSHCANFDRSNRKAWDFLASWCRGAARRDKLPLDTYGFGEQGRTK